MCEFRDEGDDVVISCDFTVIDSDNHVTGLQKQENLYYQHELSQYAQYFKLLLNSMGYEWVDEVKIVSHDSNCKVDKEYSSEDF